MISKYKSKSKYKDKYSSEKIIRLNNFKILTVGIKKYKKKEKFHFKICYVFLSDLTALQDYQLPTIEYK